MSDAPERIWTEPGMPGYTSQPCDAYSVKYIRADLAPQWHRIDDPDNPPPRDGAQILAFDGVGRFVAEWHEGGWRRSETDGEPLPTDFHPITHWMHLSQPPQESKT